MPKILALKYWPLALLTVLIVAIVCMSRYAEDRKASATADTQPGSPQLSVSPNDAGKGAKSTDKPDNSPSWVETFAWPEGVTAWALLLTLLIIAWQSTETRAAAQLADRAIESQKDTAKRQLRAYLTVKNAMLFLHEDGMVEPKIEIINSGQTPAYDFSGAYWREFRKYPIGDIGRPTPEVRKSNGSIGAGDSDWILGNITPPPVRGDNAVVLHLRSPDEVFFIKGYYTYKDIFKSPHFIEFQMIVGGPAGVKINRDQRGVYLVFSHDSIGDDHDWDE